MEIISENVSLCPREELNLDRLVRSEPFYPLNYGDVFKLFVLYYNPSKRNYKAFRSDPRGYAACALVR